MEIRKDTGDINGGIPAPDPVLQDISTGLFYALHKTPASNGLLELSWITAFEDKLNIGRMGF
jgi:hypothetical protein